MWKNKRNASFALLAMDPFVVLRLGKGRIRQEKVDVAMQVQGRRLDVHGYFITSEGSHLSIRTHDSITHKVDGSRFSVSIQEEQGRS